MRFSDAVLIAGEMKTMRHLADSQERDSHSRFLLPRLGENENAGIFCGRFGDVFFFGCRHDFGK